MIKSFRDKETEKIFQRQHSGRLPSNIYRAARVKLLMLHAAKELPELRFPSGNRLEALQGNRWGQYSIRINRQWRLCFRWREGEAWDVEIVDYH